MDEKGKQALLILKSRNEHDNQSKQQAAKYIKNSIIGNKIKKRSFIELGAIPIFVDILINEKDENLLIQSASIIGSFACRIDEGSQKVFECNGVSPLISLLSHPNPKLVECAARSLKILSLFHHPPSSFIFEESGIKLLISLFKHPLESVNEVAATIIARGLHSFGGLQSILQILLSPKSKIQEACLYAIGWLTRDNPTLSQFVMSPSQNELNTIVQLFKHKSPKIKLLAATWNILPTIIRLMSEEESVKEEAPVVLARLINDNEDLQRVASEAEAISRLGAFLKDPNCSDKLKENSLSAIAVLCSLREDSRRQVVEAKIIPQIIQCLHSQNYAIRAASCRCTKSLSRSIKHLRTSLFECTIAIPLLKLLDDQSLEVQISASATLCNLILDFSPMKQAILENGGVKKLVSLTTGQDFQLRLNCVWALKNMLFMAEPSLKESVMKELTYAKLISLIRDYEPPIAEQALSVLRNFAYKDIEQIVTDEKFSYQLIPLLESKLNSDVPEIIKQTLFVICNIVGNEKQRSSVMKSSIIHKLIHFMEHKNSEIRVAVVWCVSNLLSPEDVGLSGRISKLRELGYQEKLEALAEDQNIEVKDRVKTALTMFEKESLMNM
eukprot:gene2301-2840_t